MYVAEWAGLFQVGVNTTSCFFYFLWLWKVETFSVASLGAPSSFYILREIFPIAFCKGGEISM